MEFTHEKLQGVKRGPNPRSGWVSFGFIIVSVYIIGLSVLSAYLLVELNQLKSSTAIAINGRTTSSSLKPLKPSLDDEGFQSRRSNCSRQACEILETLVQSREQTTQERGKRRIDKFSLSSSSYTNVFAEWLVFTRWGRPTCSQNSQLLTVGNGLGVIAGLYDNSGNLLPGSEPVCVPTGATFGIGIVSGAQLRPIRFNLDGGVFGYSMNQNAYLRCAFCQIRASDKMTVYGSSCPRNWRYMYDGYMVSSSTGSGASICLDRSSSLIQPIDSNQAGMSLVKSGRYFGAQNGKPVTCSFCVRDLDTNPDNFLETIQGTGGNSESLLS